MNCRFIFLKHVLDSFYYCYDLFLSFKNLLVITSFSKLKTDLHLL